MSTTDPAEHSQQVTTDTAALRRRQPRPGDLAVEIRTLLAAAGLPCADPDADRVRAVGYTVTATGGGSATLEWFASRSLRATASDEQIRGIPFGHSALLHNEAKRHMHAAAHGLLAALGYQSSWTPDQLVCVAPERRSEPTVLAADVSRIVAELGNARLLPHAEPGTDELAGDNEDAPVAPPAQPDEPAPPTE